MIHLAGRSVDVAVAVVPSTAILFKNVTSKIYTGNFHVTQQTSDQRGSLPNPNLGRDSKSDKMA